MKTDKEIAKEAAWKFFGKLPDSIQKYFGNPSEIAEMIVHAIREYRSELFNRDDDPPF